MELLKFSIIVIHCQKMWEQELKYRSILWQRATLISWSHQVQPCAAEHETPSSMLPGPWHGNQPVFSGNHLEGMSISSAETRVPFFPKAGGRHQLLLLLWWFFASAKDRSWHNCSQGSGGKENLRCEDLNSSFFNLDHGLCCWAEGKKQTFCCSSYYIQLAGPFFNYHNTNEASGVSSSLSKYFRETFYSF